MCDTCVTHPHSRGRRSRLGWLPLATIAVVVPLLLVRPLGIVGDDVNPVSIRNVTDTAFVRDLADQGARGVTVGQTLLRRASRPRVRAVAVAFLAHERSERQVALTLRGTARVRAAARVVRSGPSPLAQALRHVREDLVLARIELRSGRDPRLKAVALRLARSQRALGARLGVVR